MLGGWRLGIVYEAYDRQFNTIVALKTLRRFVASSQFTFKREFRALGNLFHPNLVPLYELIVEEAQWFFTMELIRGLNFLAYVRPSITVGSELQRPDFDRLRASLRQLAEGVSALHQAGRLHCDLKPTNVLIEQTGRLVILDFGLVAFSDTDAAPTKERLLVGTPEYLSPEQITRSQLSAASDWYSVGTMLFEALTVRWTPKFRPVVKVEPAP
jgi:serine/threonine protein kinase